MAERAYFSRHISIAKLPQGMVSAVEADTALFNRIVHKAAAMQRHSQSAGAEEADDRLPDLRRKENRGLRESLPKSMHVVLKEMYHTDDYFTNSAIRTANASLKSVKELNKLNIEEVQSQLKDLRKERSSSKRRLTRLSNVKKMLVRVSKAVKAGRKPSYRLDGFCERFNEKTGRFEVLSYGRVKESYDNAYLFELQYVDPQIRRNRNKLRLLDEKEERLTRRIDEMKQKLPGICFGSKKLFHGEDRYPDHETWLSAFRKKRSRQLAVSGRSDAAQGNFLFRYDTASHTLTYKSQQKDADGKRIVVSFPDVCFPYGQEKVDAAVDACGDERQAVSWRVIRTGNSFLIQCMVDVQPEHRLNDYYGDGCIAMDTNYDNLSVCELDGCGNILRHKVIYFDLEGASSGHAEQILSKALDEVFALCRETEKPFAMENLKLKHTAEHYGSKRRNFVTSRFAFSKVTALAESKALKYSICLAKVSPAYTSQQGKLLFMKKYGLSIHEAASAAIGRRAMGIQERLPSCVRGLLEPDQQTLPHRKQWKAAYKFTKKMMPSGMYACRFA